MSASPEVALILRLRDMLSRELSRATSDAQRNLDNAANNGTRSAQRAVNAQQRLYSRLAAARESLGIRSEQTIQREIRQTEGAYQRLARSGTLSANEQARAYQAMLRRVRELRGEMGQIERTQRTIGDRAKSMAKIGLGVAAGAWAAAQVLKAPVDRTMSYDRRLAMMANTAFADQGVTGRIKGKSVLSDAINNAVRTGGGAKEDAAETLDSLIASGALGDGAKGRETAMALLPTLQKYATATGADPKELGMIATRAIQNFKIDPKDLPQVLDMAIVAGQEGGFELKDMAKWLPQQMAMARNLGINGKDGFAKLAAWNQASVTTAGTKDEAGNNLRDLLNEVNTPHFRANMAKEYLANGRKLKPGEKLKMQSRVDDIYLDYQNRGVNKVDATVDMMQTIFAKNKKYQDLQAKLKTLDKGDVSGRQATLESMAAQVQGTEVGKVFHNQQSLMALLSLMNQQEYVKGIEKKLPKAAGAGQTGYEVIASTPDFKTEQLKNEKSISEQRLFASFNEALGNAANRLTEYSQKYPGLSTATVGVTTALTALGAAAGGSALMRLLTAGGGSVAGGAAAGAAGSAASGAAGAAAAGAASGAAGGAAAGTAGRAVVGGAVAARVASASPYLATLSLSGDSRNKEATSQRDIELNLLEARLTELSRGRVLHKGLIFDSTGKGTDAEIQAQLREVLAGLQKLKVTVEVKNGNITAALDQLHAQRARRQ